METYYFTFGCGQVNAGKYKVITAIDSDTARTQMFAEFGDHWSMQYSEKDWNVGHITLAQRWKWDELK